MEPAGSRNAIFVAEFFGQAAHASTEPRNGCSALNAVELMNDGVNLFRERVRPTTRIHYVMPSGTKAANVVPKYAMVWYFVRDTDREGADRRYAWILDSASGAPESTRASHQFFLATGVRQYNLNQPLQEALQANLKLVGPAQCVKEQQTSARALQAHLENEERGYNPDTKPLASEVQLVRGRPTDVAEVSFVSPTAGFSVTAAAAGVPSHSWATLARRGTESAVEGAMVAAKVLAATCSDLLTNTSLLT